MEVVSILDRVLQICNEVRIVSLRPQIESCRNLLDKDNSIDVAVLGQFKAGKSSFLNRLIGSEILPVGVIPVTSVITRIN